MPRPIFRGSHGATPGAVKTLDSWFELGAFRPFTHERRATKDGQVVIKNVATAPDGAVWAKTLIW